MHPLLHRPRLGLAAALTLVASATPAIFGQTRRKT